MLPPVASVADIYNRLRAIFPEGTPHRAYCTRKMAARTVFVMLYVGAAAGTGRHIRPDQVTRMTDAQAARLTDAERMAWATASLAKSRSAIRGRWYAVNTREPIRDETLREGLMRTGAVVARTDVATTSAAPRYAVAQEFAALFDPSIKGRALETAIKRWQVVNLSAGALARVQIVRQGAVATIGGVLVRFPSGETRRLAAGPSSAISKAVVEEFAPRFLGHPGVIFLSESGDRVVARDEKIANSIGLAIPAARLLPDIVLVDLAPKTPLLVFVEVVATNGAITESRKEALLTLTSGAGFPPSQVAFLSAYMDRDRAAFKKTMANLAWGSFAWFASEPAHLIQLREGTPARVGRLHKMQA